MPTEIPRPSQCEWVEAHFNEATDPMILGLNLPCSERGGAGLVQSRSTNSIGVGRYPARENVTDFHKGERGLAPWLAANGIGRITHETLR